MSKSTYCPTEAEEQAGVVQYLTLKGLLFHHSPNEGKRSTVTGGILKRQGMSKGFPDLFIFEPRGEFCGLAIEMKSRRGRPTPEQIDWLQRLEMRGYKGYVCYGANEAVRAIDEYLSLGDKHNESI